MTLATFESLNAKLASATTIDATDATSAQIDAFIANHTNAAAGSLIEASVNASQFVSLKLAGLIAQDGVVALDATGATSVQMSQIQAGADAGLIADEAISNATVAATAAGVIGLAAQLALDASNTVDAGVTAAANSAALLGNVTTYADALASVVNLSVDHAGVAALDDTNAALLDRAIIAATVDVADLVTVNEYRTSFAPGSITSTGANTVTTSADVGYVIGMPGKFAAGAVLHMTLVNATAAQITTLTSMPQILAASSLSAADLSPAEFEALAAKIVAGQATVDATGATSAQVDAITGNLAAFGAAGLSNLLLSATKWAGLSAAQLTALATAADGAVNVEAYDPATVDASTYTGSVSIVGSTGADVIDTAIGDSTVQGGMGKDSITGGAGDDELRGGNAADTIDGAGGDDVIYAGKSATAQVLTGGTGADTFNLNAVSINTITDLGDGADIIINSADAVTTATLDADWVATIASSNAGELTIEADTNNLNLAALAGTVGATINATNAGVNTTVVGTVFADSFTVTAGGVGTTAITGGGGNDVINVLVNADATISDLNTGDSFGVANGATLGATGVTAFAANSAVSNYGGTVTIESGAASQISLANATGTTGFTVNGGNGVDIITGSAKADNLSGGASADVISGGAGNDTIAGGVGADTMTGGTGTNTFRWGAIADVTANTPDVVTDFDAVATNIMSFDASGAGSFDLVGGNTLSYFEGATGTFAATNNVVVITTAASALTSAAAATAIGSATAAYAIGDSVLFVVSNNTDSAVFQFEAALADAVVSAAELGAGPIITLTGVNSADLAALASTNFVLSN